MNLWKYIVMLWLSVLFVICLTVQIPQIPILEQSARNLFFHVPMWFVMMVCFTIGLVASILLLIRSHGRYDRLAVSANTVGFVFGICGLVTGSIWARFTWGTWWTFAEPRMNFAALAMILCGAYFLLRRAIDDAEKRDRLSAIYHIFSFSTLPFLLYILPRQLPSLHPGTENNPAFSQITDETMRWLFYGMVIGFVGLAIWLIQLVYRLHHIDYKMRIFKSST